jgi:hypothetical protein
MATDTFTIDFDFPVDKCELSFPLVADITLHRSKTYYAVSNFQSPNLAGKSLLPNLEILRKNGKWVHFDSYKETHLSEVLGNAIDAFELKCRAE